MSQVDMPMDAAKIATTPAEITLFDFIHGKVFKADIKPTQFRVRHHSLQNC
jgi:hypothetical protein